MVVEDEPDIAEVVRHNLNRSGYEVEVYGRGDTALAAINNQPPDLILLDLKLPRKNGREVLAEIKSDPDLKSIPVVILSKSSAERDVLDTYNSHANCYVQKPLDLDEFIAAVRRIEDFWISFVRLPAA